MNPDTLRQQAAEIAGEGHHGWGNTMQTAADEIERLCRLMNTLTAGNVTYWDNHGEVRHDVGTTQAEAMATFREARKLLTPNAEITGG